MWLEEANSPLRISINGKVQEVIAQQAVMLSLRKKALAGDPRALALYIKCSERALAAARAADDEGFAAMLEYKQEFERVVARRTSLGQPTDDILPHPADVIVDPRSGFHKIVGPMDARERSEYNHQLQVLTDLQESISKAAAAYSAAKPAKRIAALGRWHAIQELFDKLNDYLPPSLQRQLEDRSTHLGATKAGEFFRFTPAALEALINEVTSPRERRK